MPAFMSSPVDTFTSNGPNVSRAGNRLGVATIPPAEGYSLAWTAFSDEALAYVFQLSNLAGEVKVMAK
jgi:hypothetical protein